MTHTQSRFIAVLVCMYIVWSLRQEERGGTLRRPVRSSAVDVHSWVLFRKWKAAVEFGARRRPFQTPPRLLVSGRAFVSTENYLPFVQELARFQKMRKKRRAVKEVGDGRGARWQNSSLFRRGRCSLTVCLW